MGTRADFYVRKTAGEEKPAMDWLGSIAWDGYPEGIDQPVLSATTEEDYRKQVSDFLEKEQGTVPADGWPWPWNDSRTTDYSYIFQDGKVMASNWGYPLFDPIAPVAEDDNESDAQQDEKLSDFFPDMSTIKKVAIGSKKSGMILVTSRADGSMDVQ